METSDYGVLPGVTNELTGERIPPIIGTREELGLPPRRVGWQKSSFSNGNGGSNCVEVTEADNGKIGIRDSKNPNGPILVFTRDEWDAFVEGVIAGEFRF